MFKIVLVGRPNVGKSTLFNRLVRSDKAIVNNQPGVTRDRKYGQGSLVDLKFTLVDTAGIDDSFKANTKDESKTQTLLASKVCVLLSSLVFALKESSIPAVSTRVNLRSTKDPWPYFLSLVTPGWLLTIALSDLTKRLNKVDFPTLGLPTNTILNIF